MKYMIILIRTIVLYYILLNLIKNNWKEGADNVN
jgi:hypothetical protein